MSVTVFRQSNTIRTKNSHNLKKINYHREHRDVFSLCGSGTTYFILIFFDAFMLLISFDSVTTLPLSQTAFK